MTKVFAINGSPRKSRGNTAMILAPFLSGLTENGADVELVYASELKIKPCTCSGMECWYGSPGKCCQNDDMQELYPKLKAADILIIATPVYIPLPGDLQNFINRLCPLIKPHLEFRDGRTRAQFHPDVHIQKIVLVATGGWWERENMDTVLRIVSELAEDASVEFAGAVLRPHAFMLKKNGIVTSEGEQVLNAVKEAGGELIKVGRMSHETLEAISQPLITREELMQRYNQMVE